MNSREWSDLLAIFLLLCPGTGTGQQVSYVISDGGHSAAASGRRSPILPRMQKAQGSVVSEHSVRAFPCTSCERRGCASVCPNGIVEAGRGSRRHILATTSQLQETVRCLEVRVSELETALAESHAMHSSSPHPLLQDHTTTPSHTTDTPSCYVPSAYGQLVPSPPAVTIASTSPPAHSPPYAVSNTSPDASQMQQRFTIPYELDIPQRPLSSGENGSSSSSSDFASYVPSSYTTSDVRSNPLSGRQQGRMAVHPHPDPSLAPIYDMYPPYYQSQW
ncbi:hypothetical protein RhiJN_02005 [Ceratobasidium sp. AG-Ba]|nr:hypothetical protein RhiJN_02005 [Ceratobasidium sp. AG-Ba]QRW02939.1 hypothetical protein RhiLY_01938 [Ceratobasidium sp. AG-Ba]